MFLRQDSFVGSRFFNFKCHLVEVTLFNRDYWAPAESLLLCWSSGSRVGFFLKAPPPPSSKSALTGGTGEEQPQIDRNASDPARSVHWGKHGPKEVGMKELLILTGIQARLQRGGEMPKGVPPYSSQEPFCEAEYSRRNLFSRIMMLLHVLLHKEGNLSCTPFPFLLLALSDWWLEMMAIHKLFFFLFYDLVIAVTYFQ